VRLPLWAATSSSRTNCSRASLRQTARLAEDRPPPTFSVTVCASLAFFVSKMTL